MYCSEETHSSIEKDVKIAGIGVDNLRKIAVDETFAMRPEALERAIEADMAAGLHPACVIACLGTTGTGPMVLSSRRVAARRHPTVTSSAG